jgi:hypothetical protein
MLDPNAIRIGDRVRDEIATKAGRVQHGTIVSREGEYVTIAWDWVTQVETHFIGTWFLQPLERPTK